MRSTIRLLGSWGKRRPAWMKGMYIPDWEKYVSDDPAVLEQRYQEELQIDQSLGVETGYRPVAHQYEPPDWVKKIRAEASKCKMIPTTQTETKYLDIINRDPDQRVYAIEVVHLLECVEDELDLEVAVDGMKTAASDRHVTLTPQIFTALISACITSGQLESARYAADNFLLLGFRNVDVSDVQRVLALTPDMESQTQPHPEPWDQYMQELQASVRDRLAFEQASQEML
eukprot:NODE_4401_length_794_cov_49.575712_g4242_i0.p1 GENE.NODE_4401_length_794_cov_49.575712_g4242_i0~~NODE_4401_length_794_cov_49.575712_g4242_i0.p1  ORF type:complete len:229 (+),score=53.03 NODE_4401_length_794_cov_49.575712_g4242_i0:61-747(+)